MTGPVDPAAAVRVLHEDDDVVLVSKPGGMLVHRTALSRTRGERFLLQAVRDLAGTRVHAVHRLDRPTSGIVLFAKRPEVVPAAQAALAAARKAYLALVRGTTDEAFTVDRPLKGDDGRPREALTRFRRLATFFRLSLLSCEIETGRRHQIRRHLDHAAHQVIGDTTHGKGRINAFFRDEWGLPRMFLHATRLELAHPATGAPLAIHDPLPADLRAFLLGLPDVPADLVARL